MGLFDLFGKKKTQQPETNVPGEEDILKNRQMAANLEKAGLIFFKYKKYYAGIFTFEKLILTDALNPNAWYGLGNCLAMVSNTTQREDLLVLAIACFKKAIQANNNSHQLSEEFLDIIKNATKIPEKEFNNIKPLSTLEVEDLSSRLKLDTSIFINEFKALDEKDRMVQIIFLGESAYQTFYPLMKYAIVHEKDIDVRFAALKRIHLFQQQPDLENVFEKAIREQKGDELEPYLSMALNTIKAGWVNKFKPEKRS